MWEPTPEDPALVIVVDEYAELPEEAHDCADSVARRGRAVAVNLIAATQRPTQEAMGKHTAVRSQMDVRICLRVRERRDVDLVLGQGIIQRRLARPHTHPARDIPDIRTRTHPPAAVPGLPDHRRPGNPPRGPARPHPPALPAAGRARPRTRQDRPRTANRPRPMPVAGPGQRRRCGTR